MNDISSFPIYSFRCGDWYEWIIWYTKKDDAMTAMGDHAVNHAVNHLSHPNMPSCRPILIEYWVTYTDLTTP